MENALFEEEKIAALRAAFLVSTCYGSSKSDSSFACTAGEFGVVSLAPQADFFAI